LGHPNALMARGFRVFIGQGDKKQGSGVRLKKPLR
jgi:hypothetical protein